MKNKKVVFIKSDTPLKTWRTELMEILEKAGVNDENTMERTLIYVELHASRLGHGFLIRVDDVEVDFRDTTNFTLQIEDTHEINGDLRIYVLEEGALYIWAKSTGENVPEISHRMDPASDLIEAMLAQPA